MTFDIPGYEGRYSITEDGRVYSHHAKRFMRSSRNWRGYDAIGLYNRHGKRTTTNVHRLVALAFHPNPLGLPQANHKDGNKRNNHYSNLEWCTSAHNIQHAYNMGLQKGNIGEAHPMAKLTEAAVKEIQKRLAAGESQSFIARDYGVDQSTISLIARGKRWAHNG